jgi:uncharacterized protein YxjI
MQSQNLFAVNDQLYCVPSQVDLIMKEKLLTLVQEQFKIKDRYDNLFFQLKGKFFSIGERKSLLDKHGNMIAGMRRKLLSFKPTFICYDANRKNLFQIRKRFCDCLGIGLSVKVTNKVTGQTHKVKLEGEWLSREFKVFVKDTGQTLAVVTRNFLDLQGILFDRDKYVVSVMPGVDASFIVLLTLAIAELRSE